MVLLVLLIAASAMCCRAQFTIGDIQQGVNNYYTLNVIGAIYVQNSDFPPPATLQPVPSTGTTLPYQTYDASIYGSTGCGQSKNRTDCGCCINYASGYGLGDGVVAQYSLPFTFYKNLMIKITNSESWIDGIVYMSLYANTAYETFVKLGATQYKKKVATIIKNWRGVYFAYLQSSRGNMPNGFNYPCATICPSGTSLSINGAFPQIATSGQAFFGLGGWANYLNASYLTILEGIQAINTYALTSTQVLETLCLPTIFFNASGAGGVVDQVYMYSGLTGSTDAMHTSASPAAAPNAGNQATIESLYQDFSTAYSYMRQAVPNLEKNLKIGAGLQTGEVQSLNGQYLWAEFEGLSANVTSSILAAMGVQPQDYIVGLSGMLQGSATVRNMLTAGAAIPMGFPAYALNIATTLVGIASQQYETAYQVCSKIQDQNNACGQVSSRFTPENFIL